MRNLFQYRVFQISKVIEDCSQLTSCIGFLNSRYENTPKFKTRSRWQCMLFNSNPYFNLHQLLLSSSFQYFELFCCRYEISSHQQCRGQGKRISFLPPKPTPSLISTFSTPTSNLCNQYQLSLSASPILGKIFSRHSKQIRDADIVLYHKKACRKSSACKDEMRECEEKSNTLRLLGRRWRTGSFILTICEVPRKILWGL